MSVKMMTEIWDNSPQTGTNLLMLLAIADHANDDGMCWPAVERLAQKCRVKERQAQYIIRALEASGELSVEIGTGRGHPSHYHLKGALQRQEKGALECTLPIKRVHSGAQRVHSGAQKGAVASAPEPSLEPSLEPKTKIQERAREEATAILATEVHGKSRKGGRPSRRCPDDYVPSASVEAWAAMKYPAIIFQDALDEMRDWEFKTQRSDWDACLRTWIRRKAERLPEDQRTSLPGIPSKSQTGLSDRQYSNKVALTQWLSEEQAKDARNDDTAGQAKVLPGPRHPRLSAPGTGDNGRR